MKKISRISYGALAVLIWMISTPLMAKIIVTVEGVRSHTGNVMIGLFSSQNGFPVVGKELLGKTLPASPELTVELDGLPPGVYAISAIHDENHNGMLDQNFIGMPTEGYGFSRDARGRVSAPPFNRAAFLYNGKDIHLYVHVAY